MTEEEVVISPVTEGDLPELNRLINDPVVSQYLDLVPPVPLGRTLDFFHYMRQEGGTWLAIRVGTRLAGSVGLIPGDPWSRLGHSASLFVYLHTAWWGRGLAARGLRACIEEARRRGIVRLEVLVVDENERSRRLFLRNGFRVEGVRRCGFRGDDGFHDLLSLALVLDPPEPGPHPTGED